MKGDDSYSHCNDSTGLTFTKPRIYKTIEAIKNYVKDSELIDHNCYCMEEDIERSNATIWVTFRLREKVSQKLDEIEIFKDKYVEGGNTIQFCWWRNKKNKRYWLLHRYGKPPCREEYYNIVKGEKSISECPCSKEFPEFSNFCMDLTEILEKHAINIS